MNSVRYTLLVIFVMLISWPVIIQAPSSAWVMWLYPFSVWLASLFLVTLVGIKKTSEGDG